jgi:predicted nucleic acid-binding protein
MAVVADANLLVALRINDPRASAVGQLMAEWAAAGEVVHAPSLAMYEIASALTQLLAAGAITHDELSVAAGTVAQQHVEFHPLLDIERTVEIATRLGRRSAYDAAYIALAEQLGADLWTLDGPLARNAATLGFPVRLLEIPSERPGA